MGMDRTQRGRLVAKAIEEYLKGGKNKYGEDWKTPLSREIYLANKKSFKNLEAVRAMVRYYTGATGEAHRNRAEFIEKPKCKILVMDIETAPILGFVWGAWEQNLSLDQIKTDWFCITWAAKWLFEKKVYSAKLTPKEAKAQDDKRIMRSIWELLNEADIVITHNGDKFDFKRLNTRFLIHELPPPMPYISIDTLKHNRKQFAHTSNKLDYINNSLGVKRKLKNDGWQLWTACYKGEKKALKDMETYNIQDIIILEDLYLRIRAWIRPHPNVNLYITDGEAVECPACGKEDLAKESGRYATKTAVYGVFRCNNCGSLGRERVTRISKERAKYIKIAM